MLQIKFGILFVITIFMFYVSETLLILDLLFFIKPFQYFRHRMGFI